MKLFWLLAFFNKPYLKQYNTTYIKLGMELFIHMRSSFVSFFQPVCESFDPIVYGIICCPATRHSMKTTCTAVNKINWKCVSMFSAFFWKRNFDKTKKKSSAQLGWRCDKGILFFLKVSHLVQPKKSGVIPSYQIISQFHRILEDVWQKTVPWTMSYGKSCLRFVYIGAKAKVTSLPDGFV